MHALFTFILFLFKSSKKLGTSYFLPCIAFVWMIFLFNFGNFIVFISFLGVSLFVICAVYGSYFCIYWFLLSCAFFQIQGLEKYVMTKLFTRVFASHSDDVKLDDQLYEKMSLIQQFIQPEHLDIKPTFQNETSWLVSKGSTWYILTLSLGFVHDGMFWIPPPLLLEVIIFFSQIKV